MRRPALASLATAFALAALAACGGGSDSGPSGLAGTVGGGAFTVAEVRAITAASATPCTVPDPGGSGTLDLGVAGLKLDFTSYGNACGDYASASCQLHGGAKTVTVIFAKLNPLGTAPTLAPGTWQFYASPATAIPDGAGLLTVTYAQALSTGASPTCAGTPSPSAVGGTFRIDRVGASGVAGSVDVTFADGSRLSGAFDAPLCPGVTVDVCALAESATFCSLPPVCNP